MANTENIIGEEKFRKHRAYSCKLFVNVDTARCDLYDYYPIRISDFNLPVISGKYAEPETFFLASIDSDGQFQIFDPNAEGMELYRVPCRFEPNYKGYALPYTSQAGDFVFLAPRVPLSQIYVLYFDLQTEKHQPAERITSGLIGDGDPFVQDIGRLAVPSPSRPVWKGRGFLGQDILIVAGGYDSGIYVFEKTQAADVDWVERGRLRDRHGELITGIPAVYDINNDGKLDIVLGRLDGSIHWYENIGTNQQPVFESAKPIVYDSGEPLDVKSYLANKYISSYRADGSINPVYPEIKVVNEHGGRVHVNATPVFGNWTGPHCRDLLVGVQGGFLIYFREKAEGFSKGVLLCDMHGKLLRLDSVVFPAAIDFNSQRSDLLCGTYLGWVKYLQNVGETDSVPVFVERGNLPLERTNEYTFPLAFEAYDKRGILVGDNNGQIIEYSFDGNNFDSLRITSKICPVVRNARVNRQMALAVYDCLNGDATPDLISGDIKGGVFIYKNVGTRRNPRFLSPVELQAGGKSIKIHGGPDPVVTDDGYSKITLCPTLENGQYDLLVGSGLGRIYRYRNIGVDESACPEFAAGEVLCDTHGNEIRCHHMSAALVTDWDGDGVPDLIVGGQRNVHCCFDDDPDMASQMRWYKGSWGKEGLEFAPYIALESEGDMDFCYRPMPIHSEVKDTQRFLDISSWLYRQVDMEHPEQLELVRLMPLRLASGTENIIEAYHSVSALADGDDLIIQGSCIATLFAFRKAFVENLGYLSGEVKIEQGNQYVEVLGRSPEIKGGQLPLVRKNALSIRANRIEDDLQKSIEVSNDIWFAIPVENRFTTFNGQPVELNKAPELQLCFNSIGIYFKIFCREPLMDRLIRKIDHDNAPIQSFGDDHVGILIDRNADDENLLCWAVNANGFQREFYMEKATGLIKGPCKIGCGESIVMRSHICSDGYEIQGFIPYNKIDVPGLGHGDLCLHIYRQRSLYATKTHAFENRLSEKFGITACFD